MGIRQKLVASLVCISTLLTLVLGTVFALREQQKIVELKRDHLKHSVELAASLLREATAAEGERAIRAWNGSESGGPQFQIRWNSDHSADAPAAVDFANDSPAMMTASAPLPVGSIDGPAQLVAAERVPDSGGLLIANMSEHFVLGAALTVAAALAIAFVCQRLVVRPVQWLVAAADTMAQGDDWEPIQPEVRRRDEIGQLGDHLAELSRRLSAAVRSARHGSAHLVALRVRRELEDPLRRLTVGIATLEAAGEEEPDLKRELDQMLCQVHSLHEISRRLSEVQPDPASQDFALRASPAS